MSQKRQTPSAHSITDIQPLFEFAKLVNSSLDLSFILSSVLLTLMGKLRVTKCAILLRTTPRHFHIESAKGCERTGDRDELVMRIIPKKDISTSAQSIEYVDERLRASCTRLYPFINRNEVVGFLGLGQKYTGERLSAIEREFIGTLVNISSAAIDKAMAYREMQEINRELDSKVQELRTLFELGKSFNAVFNQEQVLKIFGLTLMGQVGSMRFAVLLREGETVSTKMDTERLDLMKDRLFLSITSPMLIPAVQSEKRPTQLFQQCRELGIEALIPLQVQNEVKGIVCLGARRTGKHYSQADLEFVFSLGNLAIISFENSRLFKEAVEKQRMESELDIAREIQRGLLPKVIPVIQGFDAAALTIPSRQVGGDYYDVIALEGGNYAFAIGDVSGKGTPASLLMASVQATVRALAHFPGSLSDLTVRINHLICENTSGGRFITFFWGILNPTTREFRYVNAGHNLPFLMRSDGSIDRLGEGGIILGVLQSGVAYREGSTSLHPGDTLLMFTDGISEAMDKNGIDYTEERIHTFLFEIRNHTASEMIEAIREEISKYTSGAPQSDDITLLVLKAR